MAETQTEPLALIWGARDIAKVINCTPNVTWRLLEAGEIAGAKKVGKRWCVSLHKLRETFGLLEAA